MAIIEDFEAGSPLSGYFDHVGGGWSADDGTNTTLIEGAWSGFHTTGSGTATTLGDVANHTGPTPGDTYTVRWRTSNNPPSNHTTFYIGTDTADPGNATGCYKLTLERDTSPHTLILAHNSGGTDTTVASIDYSHSDGDLYELRWSVSSDANPVHAIEMENVTTSTIDGTIDATDTNGDPTTGDGIGFFAHFNWEWTMDSLAVTANTTSVSESAGLTATATPSAVETAPVSESAGITATATPSVGESASASETAGLTPGVTLSASGTAPVSETGGLTASATPSAAETAPVSESAGVTASATPSASEAAPVSEVAGLTPGVTLSASEAAPVSESGGVSSVVAVGGTESASASEVAGLTPGVVVSASASAPVSEAAGLVVGVTPGARGWATARGSLSPVSVAATVGATEIVDSSAIQYTVPLEGEFALARSFTGEFAVVRRVNGEFAVVRSLTGSIDSRES